MNHLKSFFSTISISVMTLALTSCTTNTDVNSISPSFDYSHEESFNNEESKSILIAYFSCTNNTKNQAELLQEKLDADIYRIVPLIPYTSDDLNYHTNCRANQEQNDPNARPKIDGSLDHISIYSVVYIGYPIWWGEAPKIMYSFLESYDFSGITLIPFCTSASSGMGNSAKNLHALAPNAIWKDGCRVSSNYDLDTLVNMI